LIAHSERDPGHAEELDELLDGINLTDAQWTLVSLSAINTVHLLAAVFADLLRAT
jgi:hypothetical protein